MSGPVSRQCSSCLGTKLLLQVLIGPSDTELYETIGWLQGLGLIASIVTDALCFVILVIGLHLAARKSGAAGQAGFKKCVAYR